ncbi:MAG: DUF554 domain-containing protein [Syntrophomonadaceae bacterium]|jgi:uncharacterized membrane protein YqgA involved in biofilm formation|nr:DUF554 domain-containing protein [Syntrophomonadaceae bacterium]
MLGTIVNTAAILLGAVIGLLFKGGIPESYNQTIMKAIGLAVVLIGLLNAFQTENILLLIFSLAIGSLLGEMIKIENGLENLGNWLESRFSSSDSNISRGFVTSSLLFCVGAMAIVGSLESGLSGNHQTLFAKSVLDGISSIVFASTMGLGVAFSAASVFIYQGFITLTASFLQQFLIEAAITEMSAVGGLLILAIGMNILDLPRIKVGNMLPAIFLPLIYYILLPYFSILQGLF